MNVPWVRDDPDYDPGRNKLNYVDSFLKLFRVANRSLCDDRARFY